MEIKFNFVRCLGLGVLVGVIVLGGGCGGLIKVGTAKDATPPAIRFTTRPESGVVPVAVSFDASATSDSESLISSYSWDFDGDGKEDSTAQTATFTYQQPGVYYPRLKVVNSEGLVSYSAGSEIVANDKVYIRIETDKEVYKIGEDVEINLILVNASSEDLWYKHLTLPSYNLLIYSLDRKVLWKCDNRYIIADIVSVSLYIPMKSETRFALCTWSQNYGYEGGDTKDIRGFPEYTGNPEKITNQETVSSGTYNLKANLIQYDVVGHKVIQIKEDF